MSTYRRIISFESCILAFSLLLGLLISYDLIPEKGQYSFKLYSLCLCVSLYLNAFGQQSYVSYVRNISYWFSWSVLGTLMAFRAQIGIDDIVYKITFENVANLSLVEYFQISGQEKGYLLVNYILYYLTNGNYNLAQACITYSTFMLWGVAIKSQCKYNISIPIVLLLLFTHYYFFVLSAGLVRIFIAIPIVLYSLQFIWKKEPKKFILGIIVASLFHLSALSMLLFLLFIWKDEYFYKHLILFLVIVFVLLFASFIIVARFLVPLLGDRYAGYGEISSIGISIGNFDTLPILLIAAYYKRYMSGCSQIEQRRYTIGLVLLSLSVIFSVLSSMVSLGRLIFYANLGLIIVLSTIFGVRNNSGAFFGIKLTFIIYALFYLMHTTMLNPIQNETLFPYKSFLFL